LAVDITGFVAIGITAFAATNIDDIFVLILLFSSSASVTFSVSQVVLGQYVGIGLLIAISALGSLIPLVAPPYIIGLLGIVPIAIGIRRLVQILRQGAVKVSTTAVPTTPAVINRPYLYFLAVAAITFSNGGDNIGIYTPLFAQYNSISQVTTLIIVFLVMTAVWCTAAYYLVNHPFIASRINRIGHIILPFVLIGLGVYILAQAFSFLYLLVT
jgi:cadmium resistance protein CadD (predicted permease)